VAAQAEGTAQVEKMEALVAAAQAQTAAAHAEKLAVVDELRRCEGERDSFQRQLAEVSAQLQLVQAAGRELEAKGQLASAEAEVCCALHLLSGRWPSQNCACAVHLARRIPASLCLFACYLRDAVARLCAVLYVQRQERPKHGPWNAVDAALLQHSQYRKLP
jgi:hypothetical protein